MKTADIKTNSARQESGAWIGDIPEMGDFEVRVRGAQCASARALRNKLIRALPAKLRTDPAGIPIEELDRIETEVILGAILLEWRNWEDEPYSPDTARRVLADPDLAAVRDAVLWAAMQVGRHDDAAHAADLGN
ncbi:hypothetical protein [Rhodoplanes roseus]|uniref:Uncharacterized protein n=1 Tax=Rhodoplanes roseus TaxID=29409 RepID=A0A327L3E6_9BRAD|nr:hypothetical protein [Rhodoplanes roseus]RAI44704.1 hypothetical protein CH341_07760 [Rhodoplanes roseus]